MTNNKNLKVGVINSQKSQEKIFGSSQDHPRLYLTTVDNHFVPGRDLAFGPHCFIGNEDVFPDWKDIKFSEPFQTEKCLENHEEKLRQLINYLLPKLTDEFNHRNSAKYSIDFWRLLLLPWLIELSQKVWTSFSRMELLINNHAEKSFVVGVYGSTAEWSFTDTADFFSTMLSDYNFHWWIDSKILEIIAPDNWRLEPVKPNVVLSSYNLVQAPKRPSNNFRDRFVRNIKRRLGYTDILGAKWAGLFFSLYLNLLPKNPRTETFTNLSRYDPSLFFPDKFLRLFNELIYLTIPKSMEGGFYVLEKEALKLTYRPGRWRLGALNFWDDQEKVVAGMALEKGEKRLVFQHGGEYGIINYSMLFNEMEGKLCKFISWGWKPAKSKNIVPLPSPLHSKKWNTHVRQNDDIIYVSGGIRILLSRIHWAHRINAPVNYAQESVKFICGLDERIRTHTLFRPYLRTANDIETSEMVLEQFPNMKLLKGDLDSEMLKCRLVVLYSYSTAMNLALASNVPTLIHVLPERMKVNRASERYFKPLIEAGIIHLSPEAAANHLNKIWPDVESWWYSRSVQDARVQWVKNYCWVEKFWVFYWFKALRFLKLTE